MAVGTVHSAKELALRYQPLLLATFTFPDGGMDLPLQGVIVSAFPGLDDFERWGDGLRSLAWAFGPLRLLRPWQYDSLVPLDLLSAWLAYA